MRGCSATPSVGDPMSTSQADGWAGLFQKAFAQSQNAMLMVDEERRIVDVNTAFLRLVGRRRSALLGCYMYELIPGGPLLTRDEWLAAINSGADTGEVDVERADG